MRGVAREGGGDKMCEGTEGGAYAGPRTDNGLSPSADLPERSKEHQRAGLREERGWILAEDNRARVQQYQFSRLGDRKQ